MAKKKEMTKEEQIKKKIAEYRKVFADIDLNQKVFVNSIIDQIAYMEVAMDYLKIQTNTEGYTELFEQGKQSFIREHPATKVYNSYVKNFNSLIKTLLDYVPQAKEQDELQEFLKNKKR